jgi:hypothetical protein
MIVKPAQARTLRPPISAFGMLMDWGLRRSSQFESSLGLGPFVTDGVSRVFTVLVLASRRSAEAEESKPYSTSGLQLTTSIGRSAIGQASSPQSS